MDYIKFKTLKDPFISIAWYVGSICNYRCSYCIPEFYNGKKGFPDYKSFIRFTDKVKQKYPGKKIMITLYGGEVTLWKKLILFLQECKIRDISVRIISNGSRSIEWWKTVIDMIEYIVISYHTESASEDHITELMKRIKRGHVSLMVPPTVFDETIEIGKRISKNSRTFVIPKFLRKGFASELYPYTEEQLERFRKGPFGSEYLDQGEYAYRGLLIQTADGKIKEYNNVRQIFLDKLNRWNGWKCWGGIDSFFVDYDGDIFVGQCRRGKMGNINEKYELPNEAFICNKDVCNCTQDMLETNKEKII